MPHADRYAPDGRQALALSRVATAKGAKDAADAAAAEARRVWLERMFSASYQGAAHSQVARQAGIDPERYRQLRKENDYDGYVARRKGEAGAHELRKHAA